MQPLGAGYVAGMLLAGGALGLLQRARPGWSQPVPDLLVLLGVGLLLDLALQFAFRRGPMDVFDMGYRVAGFVLGGILMTVLPRLLPA